MTVRVKDAGPGIPLHDRETLFRPFVRGSERKAPGVKSTGLGLAISKKIVEAHGGTIWIEEGEGRGSVFAFRLPQTSTEEEEKGMTRDELVQSAQVLTQPAPQIVQEFSKKREEMAARVNQFMASRPDLEKLVGPDGREMSEDNNGNFSLFMESLMGHFCAGCPGGHCPLGVPRVPIPWVSDHLLAGKSQCLAGDP